MRSIAAVPGLAENTDNAFRFAVCQMADRLGTDPDWHVAVMSSETGHTFDPSIRNPQGGAVGLIQFMPSTAKRLGTTTDELAAMSQVEQLDFVEQYYQPFAGKMNSATDVYMATFMPAFVGKPDSNIIAVQGSDEMVFGIRSGTIYSQNHGFDHNNDGVITNGEVGATVEKMLANATDRIDVDDSGGADDSGPPLSPRSCSDSGSLGDSEPLTERNPTRCGS